MVSLLGWEVRRARCGSAAPSFHVFGLGGPAKSGETAYSHSVGQSFCDISGTETVSSSKLGPGNRKSIEFHICHQNSV